MIQYTTISEYIPTIVVPSDTIRITYGSDITSFFDLRIKKRSCATVILRISHKTYLIIILLLDSLLIHYLNILLIIEQIEFSFSILSFTALLLILKLSNVLRTSSASSLVL